MDTVPAKAAKGDFPDYVSELEKLKDFLRTFTPYDGDTPKYMDLLQDVANRTLQVVEVDLEDVYSYAPDGELATSIAHNAHRYIRLLYTAIDELLKGVHPTMDVTENEDVWDVLQEQRIRQQKASAEEEDNGVPGANPAAAEDLGLPAALLRRYEVRVLPRGADSETENNTGNGTNNSGVRPKRLEGDGTEEARALRHVMAEDIGRLVRIRAIVTRVSDVKPLVSVVAYTCDKCGFEVYQEVFSRQFMPLQVCPSQRCMENRSNGKLFMQTRGSRFCRFQELRIQELPDQVPIGHIPRTMTVQCHGELTRQCSPGDVATISGVFLPMRFTGFRALKAGLITDTYLDAQHIFRHKKGYAELQLTADMERRIDEVAESSDALTRLARSIAPEIYGHEDVKRALLLQLVGGVARQLPDGMRIRGDINVCLMGDPGVAKSQLLKFMASVAPRGVYTTGKGSSGVGLTAAVSRDPVTGEMALEGGALVLADMGLCCIDEFDKMDEGDRAAIHEVMEQQTVSIAKAGITTTLNARAAVLAAANPLYGRYNRRRSMSENINLPNSLLSRFDLMFLVLDRSDAAADMALARHVTYVHRHARNPDLDFEPLEPRLLKHYISQARQIEPYVPAELTSYIVEAYVGLRLQEADKPSDQTAMTPRQLLSILRLSQALARLKFCDAVTSQDVDEAIRLTHMSKASLTDDEDSQQRNYQDATSRIFAAIRDLAAALRRTSLEYGQVEAKVVNLGFRPQQLSDCLEEYEALGVLQVNSERTRIDLVNER